MNLRRRLQELERARAPVARRASSGIVSVPAGEGPASGGASGNAERDGLLADLRQRMAEILARPARAAPAPEALGEAMPLCELPFAQREVPLGTLWQRVERLPLSHRVGSVGLSLAREASTEALARLALDDAIASCQSERFCFLDLETTGLGGAGSFAFLVGMAGFDGSSGQLFIEQLLLDRPDNERALLARVAERLAEAELVVSFNGKAFDCPMLEARYVLNGLPMPRVARHLDLLHVGRRLHRRRLQGCSLKQLESAVLGFVRGEDIDGHEVASRYAHYLRSGDAAGLAAVVEHNYWDVVSMVAFVGLYGQPLPELDAEDLACLARTLRRAGAAEQATRAAELACARGGGVEALRVRAELAKARGDFTRALSDFESICAQVDDAPSRLQLAKLYEHRLRRPERALLWVDQGTGEPEAPYARRVARLRRKLERLRPGSC